MKPRTIGLAISVSLLCMTAAATAQPVLTDPNLTVETVVTGLSTPTTMAFVGPNDILVLQKNDGQVRRVLNGVVQSTVALDVAVSNDSERGLLGIAVNSENPPKVFLYYTESTVDGGTPLGNRLYRYDWNSATGLLTNPLLIRDFPVTPGPNHDAGMVLLGPPESGLPGDGRPLYVIVGELNRNGQLQNNSTGAAPDDTGVILRLRQDGTAHPLNPLFPYCSTSTTTTCTNDAGCPSGQTCITKVASYFAYGVRNSFGLTIDPVTAKLWDTENGPNSYDEVNLVEAGFNSGWNKIQGPLSRNSNGLSTLFDMPGSADQLFGSRVLVARARRAGGDHFPGGQHHGSRLRQRRARRRLQRRPNLQLAAERHAHGLHFDRRIGGSRRGQQHGARSGEARLRLRRRDRHGHRARRRAVRAVDRQRCDLPHPCGRRHTDTNEYRDPYADEHPDAYADPDQHADQHAHEYADERTDEHPGHSADEHPDPYTDEYADQHADAVDRARRRPRSQRGAPGIALARHGDDHRSRRDQRPGFWRRGERHVERRGIRVRLVHDRPGRRLRRDEPGDPQKEPVRDVDRRRCVGGREGIPAEREPRPGWRQQRHHDHRSQALSVNAAWRSENRPSRRP